MSFLISSIFNKIRDFTILTSVWTYSRSLWLLNHQDSNLQFSLFSDLELSRFSTQFRNTSFTMLRLKKNSSFLYWEYVYVSFVYSY